MNNFLDLSIISIVMPILVAMIVLITIVVHIIVYGKTKQIQSLAITQKSFEQLAHELKADNIVLKSELTAIRENLNSINTMMEEIQ